MKDLNGYIINGIDNRLMLYKMLLISIMVKLDAKIRGITLGRNCSFYGRTFFRRFRGSTIRISNNCRFRSSFLSNLVGINRSCLISTFNENAIIEIKEYSGFSGTVIGCANSIKIGKNVLCGGNTFITDFDWHPINRGETKQVAESSPVIIEDSVWLGLNVVVLKGVTIGHNSVIGANSVVTKSIPSNVIAAGNPCKVLKGILKNGKK